MNSNFVIICLGRTGSTLLGHLLNSHPDIECGQELFNPIEGKFLNFPGIGRRAFLEGYARESDKKPIFGFKMPFDWLVRHPGIMDDFAALKYQVIRLDRREELAHFVSAKLAEANTNWGSRSTYAEQRLRVDPAEFLAWLGYRATANWALDAMCEGFPVVRIDYDELLVPEGQLRLLKFLAADPVSLTTPTIRSRVLSLHESIINYDELHQALSGTVYAPHAPARPIAVGAVPAATFDDLPTQRPPARTQLLHAFGMYAKNRGLSTAAIKAATWVNRSVSRLKH